MVIVNSGRGVSFTALLFNERLEKRGKSSRGEGKGLLT